MSLLIYLGIGWIAYYLIHSLLASNISKEAAAKFLGKFSHLYRIFYNFISIIGFAGLIYFQMSLSFNKFFSDQRLLDLIALVILFSGVLIGYFGFKGYDSGEFFGFRQMKEGIINSKQALNTTGLNQYVRHPLYTGTLFIILGCLLYYRDLPIIIFSSCTLIYLILGIYWEEKKLVKMYGEAYLEYRKEVKALIPWIV